MAELQKLSGANGLYRDLTTLDIVLVYAGKVLQSWKSNDDIDILLVEARGDLMAHDGTQWQRLIAKTSAQVVVGDGDDPISAPIAGDVAASIVGTDLQMLVNDLTITSEVQGDLLMFNGSNWVRFAAKTAGQMVIGDGTDVISKAMSGDGELDAAGVFLATHKVLLHMRIPYVSGIDTDVKKGGLAGCDATNDVVIAQANATHCKVWDDNAPTNTQQASALCKVEDAVQPIQASATYCKVYDGELHTAAPITHCKVWDESAAGYEELETASGGDFIQWQLLPDNTQVDDAVYFGAAAAFSELYLDLSATTQTYTDDAMIWEYWNGAAWVALTVVDGTNATETSGSMPFVQDGHISWTAPGDWAAVSVDSVNIFWIRCVVDTPLNVAQLAITNTTRHAIVTNDEYEELETATAKDFTQWALLPAVGNLENDDAVYFGGVAAFAEIWSDLSATVQTYTGNATLWEYWDGDSWETLTVTDGTDAVGGDGLRSFAQDGYTSFTAPGDWASSTIDGVTAFWIRCRVTAAASITQVGITNSVRHYLVERNVFANLDDASVADFVQWALFPSNTTADDTVYFGAAAQFQEIYNDVSATNQTYTGDGTTYEYWNGAAWFALVVTDGTDTAGGDGLRSFTQDGYTSFTIPGDWATTTIDGQLAYWIRATVTTAGNISQIGILDSVRHSTTVRGIFEELETGSADDFVQWQLFPDNTEDTDICYFGGALQWCEMWMDVSATVQTYTGDALSWEYWDGAAWQTLALAHDYTDATAQDGLRSFGRDGAISFVPPADWAESTIDTVEAYWIRCSAGTVANITQIAITNSVRHYFCKPYDNFTVVHDGRITDIRIRDEAATVHSSADIKFILMNFNTGLHSGELTFGQDKRSDFWWALTLDVSEDDVLGVLITQEDGTNEAGPFSLELTEQLS